MFDKCKDCKHDYKKCILVDSSEVDNCEFFSVEDANKFINNCCNYINNEYIKQGGKSNSLNKDATYWALHGIFDREGATALIEYIKNWKPYIKVARNDIGYAGNSLALN